MIYIVGKLWISAFMSSSPHPAEMNLLAVRFLVTLWQRIVSMIWEFVLTMTIYTAAASASALSYTMDRVRFKIHNQFNVKCICKSKVWFWFCIAFKDEMLFLRDFVELCFTKLCDARFSRHLFPVSERVNPQSWPRLTEFRRPEDTSGRGTLVTLVGSFWIQYWFSRRCNTMKEWWA